MELHEFVQAGLTDLVVKRLDPTHDCRLIDGHGRNPKDYPELAGMGDQDALLAIDEFRPELMRWALFTPR